MPDDYEDRGYREYADDDRPAPARRSRDDDYDDRPVKRRRPQPSGYYRPKEDEANSAMLCHLLAIFTGFIGPIIMWTSKKDESRFVDYHGREALNFSLNILIYNLSATAVLTVIAFVTCGFGAVLFPLVFGIYIYALVMHIIALNAAKRGEWYRYPMTFRMIGPPSGMEGLAPAGDYRDEPARVSTDNGGDYVDDDRAPAPAQKGSMLWLWITGGVCLLALGGCCVGGIVFAVLNWERSIEKGPAVVASSSDTMRPVQNPMRPADPIKPAEPIVPGGLPPLPDTIDGALKGLESKDLFQRARSADALATMKPNPARRAEVLKALQKQLQDAEKFPQDAAMRGLIAWATTKDDVPLLLEMLKKANFVDKKKILQTLGTLKDARASAEIAEAMKDFGAYRAAVDALKQIGPAAEDDVLPLLKIKNAYTPSGAVEVLKEIGTKKSLEALEALSKDGRGLIKNQAKQAADAIKARNP